MRTVSLAMAVGVVAALLAVAPSAGAAFGDEFGAAPINDGTGPAEEAPAYPGDRAFWAGACDRGAAPAFGQSMGGAGGFGERPSEILVPTGGTPAQALAPAPEMPDHCIDWGAQTVYLVQPNIWQRIPWAGQDEPAGDYAPSWRLPAVTQAGAHPDGTTTLAFARNSQDRVDGSLDNIVVDLPPGFVGNPQAVPECRAEDFDARPLLCPPESQVGVIRLNIEAFPFGGANLGFGYDATYPLYNLEPRKGRVAELGFGYASGESLVAVRLVGKARTSGDYGVTAFAAQVPAALAPVAQSVTLWGVPWAAANDLWRTRLGHFEDAPCKRQPDLPLSKQYIPPSGLVPACRASYDADWGPIKPFLTNETDCNPAPTVRMAMDSYQNPGTFTADGDPDPADTTGWKRYESESPPVTGCADLDFEPDIEFQPTTSAADAASGLGVELSLPQSNEPPAAVASDPGLQIDDPGYDPGDGAPGHWRSQEGLATAHLKDTVVTLPAGLSVNPSASPGQQGCSDGQIGVRGFDSEHGRPLFNNGDPFDGSAGDGAECPQGSIIGTARVQTPLLEEDLTGHVVLGQPKSTDPTSGDMFRLFLVVRNRERGLIVKIFGSSVADTRTGQLTTTFVNNPELPFDKLELDIEGGDRGLLALPQRCGSHGWSSTFTPWSAAHGGGGQDVADGGAIPTTSNCGYPFAPRLSAGTTPRQGGGSSRFELTFSRSDGEQWFRGLTAEIPTGLLAAVGDVSLCSDAQAARGSCPLASRIGSVDAGAGSGNPFFLERKGDIYLTEGYKGAPYGLMVRVPVEAGPFRGALALTPIVVRQALHVDRNSARVTAVSDPFPEIWHGIPLRVRQVTAVIDRPGFMRNPTDCSPKRILARLTSVEGSVALPVSPFRASGCAGLPFRPKLALALKGRRQTKTNGHPAVRARVRQRRPEAAIRRAVVRLPRSLALDPANAQALCEFEDGTRGDPENHCPRGSIVGRARAVSPLLRDPLVGNVFFVKNVRTDPETGNTIRTLPMLIVALRGEIAINLRGESSVDRRNRLVNTFKAVPDAPVSRFGMRIKGGRNGILTVTRTRRGTIDLCARRQIGRTAMRGHNGRRHAPRIRIKTPCAKQRKAVCRTKKQRRTRACKRRAAKRRAARA